MWCDTDVYFDVKSKGNAVINFWPSFFFFFFYNNNKNKMCKNISIIESSRVTFPSLSVDTINTPQPRPV